MHNIERQYLDLMNTIMTEGDERIDRTGVGTLAIFGASMKFDLSEGIVPIMTTKRVYWKTAIKELLWFLTGDTNIQSLLKQNVTIWTDWPLKRYRKVTGQSISQADFEQRILEDDAFAEEWGDLGPVYGKQWRAWEGKDGRIHDQIANTIELLKTDPFSRRILFHAWNVGELDKMALHPCHNTYSYGCKNGPDGRLIVSGSLHQRSADSLLGLPWNLLSSSALLMMIAQQCDMDVGNMTWFGNDVHIYLNHREQVREQLSRPLRQLPKMRLARKPASIDDYKIEDFIVEGYDPHPAISADVAV